jgi:hypothetical protein
MTDRQYKLSQLRLTFTSRDHNKWICAFDDVSGIIHDVLANGAKLAIISRNRSKAM